MYLCIMYSVIDIKNRYIKSIYTRPLRISRKYYLYQVIFKALFSFLNYENPIVSALSTIQNIITL